MRIAICDDDQVFAEQAKSVILEQQPLFHNLVIQTFEDGDRLIKAHATIPFDIIFLDVVMPLFSGIEAAREIRQNDRMVKIVFLTSSPEFAVDSYTVKANNYLLKPLDSVRMHNCLQELFTEIRSSERSISIKSANTVHRVLLRSIVYIEAQNKHVQFTLTDGSRIVSTEPLYTIESRLALTDGFYKCSRSYLVNMHHIESYSAKELLLRSGDRIPISRNRHKEFEEVYFSAIFGKAGETL